MKQFFITATDTDAGKTFVSCALIKALTQAPTKTNCQVSTQFVAGDTNVCVNKPSKVAAFKPVAAGCELVEGQLINEDAKLLSEFANCGQSIIDINPIAFAEPIAPHIAAKKQNQKINVADINHHYLAVKSLNADVTLVEGAGGWRLPLGPSSLAPLSAESMSLNINTAISTSNNKSNSPNNTLTADGQKPAYQFLSDFVKAAELEVILIVNMKLGCLNHALLTYETIKADGLHCIAWIANCAASEPMDNLAENVTELEQLLPMPKIAQFDYFNDVDSQGNEISFDEKINLAARKINLAPLLK
ncbi:MAG: dethiobiotin synthase [Colwellia sp.]|uniref:ATP-dependent dethiobiotin synthetase BioD n=1 Tax=Colwellia sp. TaxID=56799 RepID=UPI0025C46BAA|nr:ATP-dependent dethiobiotin synthetase BioD [Colwellia sp.]NQZ27767.1 dethiobiotin synthase [Colwellia sp.]